MPPSDYIKSRESAKQNNNQFYTAVVDGRPYLPNLTVDASDTKSVCKAAIVNVILSLYNSAITSPKEEGGEGTQANVNSNKSLETILLKDELFKSLTCTKVTGGITNALFRVSGFEELKDKISSIVCQLISSCNTGGDSGSVLSADGIKSLIDYNSVLIRIFGAEGMIDRDVETSTYAALCNADIAYRYLGRFNNGRIEGWLDGFVPLKCTDLTHDGTSLEIAKEMARLHCLFEVPEGELRNHHFGTDLDAITVGLWDQLSSWMEQAKGYSEFKTPNDTERVKALELDKIEIEVEKFIKSFSSTSSDNDDIDSGDSTESICGSAKKKSGIVFCHNDLLAANIMRHPETSKIQLIDFEYGGTNYAAFDIANHFNEYAGGTTVEDNGVTDYSRFPSHSKQKDFIREYVKTAKRFESDLTESSDDDMDVDLSDEVTSLLEQVQKFILINHLYWGLWAINQAADEGCEEFDYINYATNRFKEFHAAKER